jgi:Mn-containing catalase
MFMKALDSMGKLDDPFFGTIQPDDTVEIVYNLSQGGGDVRGAWNEAPFKYVEKPDATGKLPAGPINPDDEHRRGAKAVRH